MQKFVERAKHHLRYLAHELTHKLKGDTRCEFEKYVDKCRFLRLPNVISNPGKCSNPAHQH